MTPLLLPVVQVRVSVFTTVGVAQRTLLILTVEGLVKFLPLMVISVPPVTEPAVGVTERAVGGVRYVKALVSVTLSFPGFETVMFEEPENPKGVRHSISSPVGETLVTIQAPRPIWTVDEAKKLVPVIVIAVPPVIGPFSGETVLIVGRG